MAWLTAYLTTVGHHIPKDFPKSPSALLKKQQPATEMTPQQWAAFASAVLGKPVPLQVPTDAEVEAYG